MPFLGLKRSVDYGDDRILVELDMPFSYLEGVLKTRSLSGISEMRFSWWISWDLSVSAL